MNDKIRLTREEARQYLLGQLRLNEPAKPSGAEGVRTLLRELRCIQLDPLDPLGTNADLVVLARVDKVRRGDLFQYVYPGYAFEHFAKERCLLPAEAFPWYEGAAAETPWWRLSERLKRLPPKVLEEVLHEIEARGPLCPSDLTDRGRVNPLDWSGWKGTGRAASMALEVLWTRCQVVVCGRTRNTRYFDIPSRALPQVTGMKQCDFYRWALLQRVEAAGLLARAGGAVWSMLASVRGTPLVETLIQEGALEEVVVEGGSRTYLAPGGFRERRFPEADARMRILGPLDPLLWDRVLVQQVFGFEYVWEVYKPAEKRRWGWYVCPLLHRGALVGRLEGRIEDNVLNIARIWGEPDRRLEVRALDAALDRHARACGVEEFRRPPLP